MTKPKTIDELSDAELLTSIYGEHSTHPKALVRILTDAERLSYRERLKISARQISAKHLGIDTKGPPFEVPCPACFAFALAPCMTEPRGDPGFRFPETARVVDGWHSERMVAWEKNPEIRVKVT